MNLKEIVNDPETTFLDVREADELVNDGKIDKAVHIPMDDVPYQVDEIKAMKKPIVVFCRAGRRAEKVIEFLEQNDIEELYNGGGLTDMKKMLENS
ncbi:MAG: rhodanese-like domain-containing protein [Flavobacteriales bacterium]